MAETLVTDIEGPSGKAALYEVSTTLPNGVMDTEYEVRCGVIHNRRYT